MESKILFFINYMNTVKRASKNTLESYKRDLELMKEFFYGQNIVEVDKITGTNINSYIMYLEKLGKSPATIARTISTIKTFFRCMMNNGYVKREPTESVSVPQLQKEKTKTKTISKDEVKKLVKTISEEDDMSKRDRVMIELLYDCEIKVSELVQLKLDDINMSYSYITCHGKKRDKTIPVSASVNKILSDYIVSTRSSFIKDEDSGYVFLNYLGKQMSRQGFWKIFKKYAKLAGDEQLTTYAMHK